MFWTKFSTQSYHVFLESEGDGGSGGGSGGGKTYTQEDLDREINSIRQKNNDLIEEKRRMAEQLKQFEGIDVNKIKEVMARFETDEEGKLIAEGKIDEVLNRRTERMRTAYENKLQESITQLAQKENDAKTFQTKYDQLVVAQSLRDAATKAGVLPEAIEDVLFRGSRVFQVKEDSVVSVDPDTGSVRIGSDGNQPYSAADFINELKKQAPHYWPGNTAGGFRGGIDGGASIDDQMAAAAAKGDMKLYRTLREKKMKVNK